MNPEIRDIWISHSQSTGNEILKHRLENLKHFKCFIGTILVSKAKVFILEIEENTEVNRNNLKRFSGVEIQVLDTDIRELVVILLEEDLTDIFIVFIEDIVAELSNANSVQEAVNVLSRKVSYWKRLFGKYSTGMLTPYEQRGLYGELSFIKILLENSISQLHVINSWKAPTGTNQDFYFENIAFEVKTSKSNAPSIKISNEYQLDNTGYNSLFLVFFRLNETPSGKDTLLSLINEIRTLLGETEPRRDFESMINYVGISKQLEEEYNNTSYHIRSAHYYRVAEMFPRITDAVIDNAISHVSYEIYPGGCKSFEIPFVDLINEIRNAKP